MNKPGFPRRYYEPIRLRSEPDLAPPQVNIVEGVNCAEESIRIVNGGSMLERSGRQPVVGWILDTRKSIPDTRQ